MSMISFQYPKYNGAKFSLNHSLFLVEDCSNLTCYTCSFENVGHNDEENTCRVNQFYRSNVYTYHRKGKGGGGGSGAKSTRVLVKVTD